MQFGDYRVEVIPDTVFRLDGGAMFGVVPRTLWEQRAIPDERNRIALNANCLFIEAGTERILVDTGMGEKWSPAEADRFAIERECSFAEALRERTGTDPDDITVVVNTHLHFDHAGGNTIRDGAGQLTPAFPRARYFASRSEFEHASAPSERDRASYVSDNWTPLEASGQLELKDDDYEIVPGLTMETVPGHSRTMQCLRLERGGRVLFGFADLLPTVAHLPLAWVMGYDLYPAETVESKKRLLRDAAANAWVCHFYHDTERPLGHVREQNGKYIFAELEQVNGKVRIGIIGGSGLYQMPEFTDVEEVVLDTPHGAPSDSYLIGTLGGERIAFLPRHGRGHRILPTDLPFRANIYGFKMLGVEFILSASAVGSLQEQYAPKDMVIPDQFFDRTRARAHQSTFFGDGIVGHITFAHPVCSELGEILERACGSTEVKVHRGGTYVCMEGPAFSTLAESNTYRQWGMDIIGMTNLQEAKLAREAEICYATLALVTDYDCWHEEHDAVTADQVIEVLHQNVRHAQIIMREAVQGLKDHRATCGHDAALKNAIFTAPDLWPDETFKKLEAIIGKYRTPQSN